MIRMTREHTISPIAVHLVSHRLQNDWMCCDKRLISGDCLRQAMSKSMTDVEASSFPSVFGRVAELPSSKRRGGRDIKKDAAKPPLMERTGWSGTRKHFGLPDHPVCGAKVCFAVFFLMPQPPLLFQEGSC